MANEIYQARSDAAAKKCKAAWEHAFKHNPTFKTLFPATFIGGRCDKEACYLCDEWNSGVTLTVT